MQDELFLTKQNKKSIRNAFVNNMSTDIKLSKAQISKVVQLGVFLGKTLGNMMNKLGEKVLLHFAVPLVKDVLPKLANKVTLSM